MSLIHEAVNGDEVEVYDATGKLRWRIVFARNAMRVTITNGRAPSILVVDNKTLRIGSVARRKGQK